MSTLHGISADDTIETLLARQPHAARVLIDRGMHCVGCAIAPYETIGEACATYGVPVEELLTALDRPPDAEKDVTP